MCPPFFNLLSVCLLSVVMVGFAQATTYYVSPSGNDSANGTSTPWQTIGKVNGINFAAGDQILFEGSQTFSGNLAFGSASGSADAGTSLNPIIVGSYGTGRATLNAGSGKGLAVYNTGGFIIRDLIFTGNWNATTQSGNTGTGIEVYLDLGGTTKRSFFRVDNVEAKGFKANGIVFGSYPADGTKSGFLDVQITRCVAHDNGGGGIFSYGYFNNTATSYAHADMLVQDCRVYNNRGVQNTGNNSGNGIVMSDVNRCTVERCIAYLNGDLNNHTGGGPDGIWTYDSNAVILQFNEAYSNKSGGTTPDGGGFDLDGGVTNSIMQYNYSHDNEGAGYLLYQFSVARPSMANNIVRYNISQNDGRKGGYAGIYLGGGTEVQNNHIYNNTVYVSPASSGTPSALKNIGIGTGNTVRNNIFVTTNGLPMVDSVSTTPASLLFQGNDYWSSGSAFVIQWGATTYSSLSAWRTATAEEKNGATDTGLAANPLLTSPGTGGIIGNPDALSTLTAYQLLSGSPLMNTGLNLTASPFNLTVGVRDFYGNAIPRGSGYDVGAHEANNPPTVATAAAASPNPATSSTTTLTVLGADDSDEANLTYTWSTTGFPPAPVTFSPNQTNGAKSVGASFTAAGTYNFIVTITDSEGRFATTPVQVVVNPNYDVWAAGYGLSGSSAAAGADPDGNGVSNLVEYALGIPHGSSDRSALPTVDNSGGNLSITYAPLQTDVIYQAEWSVNLASWSTVGISTAPSGTMVTASVPVGMDPKKFIRLRLTK